MKKNLICLVTCFAILMSASTYAEDNQTPVTAEPVQKEAIAESTDAPSQKEAIAEPTATPAQKKTLTKKVVPPPVQKKTLTKKNVPPSVQKDSKKSRRAKNNIKFSLGIPRLMTGEYERDLFLPNLSVFVNYGFGKVSVASVKTKISGLGAGARYRVPFLGYLGLGFGTLKVSYSYTQTVSLHDINAGQLVDVEGKMNGLLLEWGKDFKIGPILLGGNAGYIMGKPTVTSAKVNGVDADTKGVNSGLVTTNGVPHIGFYLGYSF